MTREEVVKWLESLKKEIGKAENRTLWHYAEAIDMAIEALSEEQKTKCIVQIKIDQDDIEDFVNEKVNEIVKKMKESKTGKWLWDIEGYFYCSRCGKKPNDQTRTTNFCPNCGTNMGGEKE